MQQIAIPLRLSMCLSRPHPRLYAFLLLFFTLWSASGLKAQTNQAPVLKKLIDSLLLPIPDSQKTQLAITISAHYAKAPGSTKKNMDTASIYCEKAALFAEKTGSELLMARAKMQKAKLLLLNREFTQGISLFKQSENYFLEHNLLPEVSTAWWWVQNNVVRYEQTFDFMLNVAEQSTKYYHKVNYKVWKYLSLATIADIHFQQGYLDNAEEEMEAIIKGLEEAKYNYIHYYYHQLSYIARYKGNYAKALHFDLEAVNNLVLPRDSFYARKYYIDIGDLYYNFEQKDKYREYNLKAAQYFQGKTPLSHAFHEATILAFRDSNYQKTLDVLLTGVKNYPPVNPSELYNANLQIAYSYAILKQYALAEKYYLEILKQEQELNRGHNMNALYTHYYVAKFYCTWEKFDKAEPLVARLLLVPKGRSPLGVQREAHYMKYQIDSAKGNFKSALFHLLKFKEYYDIIYSTTKSWQLQEITIKYETQQKEHLLKALTDSNLYQQARFRILSDSIIADTRQRQIEDLKKRLELSRKNKDLRLLYAENLLSQSKVTLLSDSIENTKRLRQLWDQQQQLLASQKEQRIKLLSSETELGRRRLADAQLRQKLNVIGIGLLLLLCATLGYFYWLKQKNNKHIQSANKALKRLVDEKEWLLKEVHHRVKNNLHTVVSLLESQSTFLSDDALAAVVSSQNRVYTMSLIHQKLYTSENITQVDMSVYLPELIQYLEQCFEVRSKIRFTHTIERIRLSGSMAVPVGLIVNEAVTNSIKYAFADSRSPCIHISLQTVDVCKVKLSIADNGRGIAQQALHNHKNSLGLTLMQGLAKDIGGKLAIANAGGTSISVIFDLVDEPVCEEMSTAQG
ncbi:MAG TPA: sensor histidine kinase [Flavisolibacter sp.]|nr:sensor histidine kinase [Flavisolibacter sp.]